MNIWLYVSLLVSACFSYIDGQCDDQTEVSSNRTKMSDGTFMTNVGDTESTFIQCNLTCTNCIMEYLFWIKDGESVYVKWWTEDGTTGPEAGFEGRVNPDLIEVAENRTYVLEWNQTLWSDLPMASVSTEWTCYFELGSCGAPAVSTDIEYFRRPLLSCYVNGSLIEDCCVLDTIASNSTFNCSVISHPESRVSLWKHHVVISNQSSCSSYSEYESICSVSVSDVDLSEGYHCTADYDSPQSGKVETIEFPGCYATTPSGSPTPPARGNPAPEGLDGWAVGLIVIASVAVAGGAVIGAVYFVKVKKKTSTAD